MKKTAKGWKLFKCYEKGELYCAPGGKRHYFEKGKWYSVEGEIEFCKNGFHFHENIADLNKYYDLREDILCEVSCKEVLSGDDKSVCRSFKILKSLSQDEKLKLVNAGKDNLGIYNSGNSNSGYYNSGYYNSGNYNSGNSNIGNSNSGCCNSGNSNSGNSNSGYYNSGHFNIGRYNSGNNNSGDLNSGGYNSGNNNSGDWNSCSYSCGSFNTITPDSILFFNKGLPMSEYQRLQYPKFIFFSLNRFIHTSDMTEEEKNRYQEHKTTGGYLKTLGYKDAFIKSFNETTPEDVEKLLKLPNFDYDVFEEISGISREMIEKKLANL